MLTITRLATLFDAIGTGIGLAFWRANTDMARPDYPYGTWLKMTELQQGEREHVITLTKQSPDPIAGPMFTESRRKYSRSLVSVNFVASDLNGRDGLELCQGYAKSFLDYIGKVEYSDLVIYVPNPTIEDRTAFLDGAIYEYKVGLDVQVTYTDNVTRDVEAMTRIEVTNTTASELIVVEE